MTDTACPKCGKPVRPGARFCGSCGHTMSSTAAARAQASPPLTAGSVCLHCGKPVRPGAKFCPSCGKAVAPAGVQPAGQAPTPAPRSAPVPPRDASKAPSPVPERQRAPERKPGMPAPPPMPPGGKKPKKFSRKSGVLIVITMVLCCIIIISGVLLYQYDPLGLGFNPTPTSTVTPTAKSSPTVTPTPTKPTETPVPTATEIPTITPTETATIAILTAAAQTLEAGLTQTSRPTATTTSTEAPTPTGANTPTTMPGSFILEDDFSGELQVNWIPWGESPPQIQNNELELTSVSPGNNGVTSQPVIRMTSGVTLQFTAQVQAPDPQNVILFNWDAGETQRLPNDPPGAVHVQIGDGTQLFVISGTSFTCPNPMVDTRPHLYEIKVDVGLRVSFWVDGNRVCEKYEPSLQGDGRISFSGNGKIDDVKVTAP